MTFTVGFGLDVGAEYRPAPDAPVRLLPDEALVLAVRLLTLLDTALAAALPLPPR